MRSAGWWTGGARAAGRSAAGLRAAVAAGLLLGALAGCDSSTPEDGDPVALERAAGGGDALAVSPEEAAGEPADAVALRDGVQVAPGTTLIQPGVGETASGWYAALDLGTAAPAEVADFYAEHLTGLGFAVSRGADPLTVLATRPAGPTTEVRVDVVPTSGEVPGFARLVASA